MRLKPWSGLALALTLSLLAGCRPEVLNPTTTALRFVPQALGFGTVYADGAPHTAVVSVINDGRSPVDVTWTPPGEPFHFELPARLPPGETVLTVTLQSTVPALYSRRLTVRTSGAEPAQLLLTARVQPIPLCEPSSDCVSAAFDVAKGECVESPLSDGTACSQTSKCLTNAACQAGRCIGTAVTCDDGDVCTVDVCREEVGCEFLPRPPCPGDGACMKGVCDPQTGCGLAPMDDGTSCGSLHGCSAAEVCISGACVVRDPPDGYLCSEASPCQGEGRCVADVCVTPSPSKTMLFNDWRYDSALTGDPDNNVPPQQYHDFVMEPSGAISLGGFFYSPPLLRANTLAALEAPEGASRRCLVWNGRIVCADYPAAPNGRITAINPATGESEWTYDVRTSRPDFTAQTTQIFMARLVVQSSDRLAALFESYPRVTNGSGSPALCRGYYLVVMDAQGREVMARPITDPLLDVCNHPHPYGVASDSLGNLYIAFSPTISAQAPLVPDRPTMLISYNRDGLFRWKVTDFTMKGGELAVARGLLYPENSDIVVNAATGQAHFGIPSPLGRAVVADTRFVAAPQVGGTSIAGYEAGTPTQRWVHTLPSGERFWSDQMRLARWSTSRGPRTVALTFVQDSSGPLPLRSLKAIDVVTGAEGFTCPMSMVNERTAPQLFEVGPGSMSVMTGAMDGEGNPACGKCDPPFAGSSAAFSSFPLTGLTIAQEPWVGTFGGEGHDHHEDTVPLGPAGPGM